MKSRTAAENAEQPPPKPRAISIPEIALVVAYFLAVWLIPTSWLDTAVGAIAFAITSKVNPYLSEYSIAFADDPQYFIHCHVLATWMIVPGVYPLMLRRNGGAAAYAKVIQGKLETFGGVTIYIIAASVFFGALYFGMLQLVDYPLTRGEWAIWIGGVSYSALMLSAILSLWGGVVFMAIYTHWFTSKGEVR